MPRPRRLCILVVCAVVMGGLTLAYSRPSSPATAELAGNGMVIASQIGASVGYMAAEGDWAYLTVGSRLAVVDASDPNLPRTVGWSVPLPRLPVGLAAQNGYVHLALERQGYQVIDATHPSEPKPIAYLDALPSWPRSVDVAGALAVVSGAGFSEQYDQVGVLDVSTPAAPVQLAVASTSDSWGTEGRVAIVGETAWLPRGQSMDILDLADPRNPLPGPTVAWPGWRIAGLTAREPLAYVVGGPQPTPPAGRDEGSMAVQRPSRVAAPAAVDFTLLRLMDVTAPLRPQEVARVASAGLDAGESVAAADGLAYVLASYPSDAIRVYDVSAPERLSLLGEVKVHSSANSLRALGRDGQRAAFLSNDGLTLVDLADPRSPRLGGTVPFTEWGIRGVAAMDGHVFVADKRFGLRIVDATDPLSPRDVGDARTTGSLMAVAVARAPGGSSGQDRQLAYGVGSDDLVIFDVTDPTAPQQLGSVSAAGSDIAVVDDHAYVAAWEDGLQIVDVSEPTDPRLIGSLVIGGDERPLPQANYVAAEGSYAYVVYRRQKLLQVVDVSDPDHPREVGRTPERIGNVEPADIAVADGHVYIVGDSSGSGPGLEVYDVRDPADPHQIGFLRTNTDVHAITLAGQRAFVADVLVHEKPVLLRVDISDPRDPRALDSVEVPGGLFDLAADGDTVYAADVGNGQYKAGLTIVRAGPSVPPSASATPVTATAAVTPGATPTLPSPPSMRPPSRLAFLPFLQRSD